MGQRAQWTDSRPSRFSECASEGQRVRSGAAWRYLFPGVQPLLDAKKSVSNIGEHVVS
jgi:hypothetical protein